MPNKYLKIVAAFIGVLLLTLFNNCGRVGFDADRWAAWDLSSSSTAACDAELKTVYSSTYFPYLSTSCKNCHSNAHGSSDLNTSYSSFKIKTAATIDSKAADGHNGLIGSQQAAAIAAFKPQWTAGNERYMACVAAGPATGGGPNIRVLPKAIPNLEATRTARNTWQTVTWDVENEVIEADRGRFKLSFKIEARYAMTGTVVNGIEFRNPSMRLTSAGTALLINGLNVFVDGAIASDVTSYVTLNASIPGIVDVPLAPGAANAFAFYPAAAAGTQVAFELTNVREDNGSGTTGGSTGGSTGGVTGGTPTTVSYTQLMSTNASLNVFATSCTSCHRSGNAAGGLDLTNYASARAAASDIRLRMNSAANPMPPSGVLPGNRRDLVDVWVNTGAPQ